MLTRRYLSKICRADSQLQAEWEKDGYVVNAIQKIADTAYSVPLVSQMCEVHGVTPDDLAYILGAMLESVSDSPAIKLMDGSVIMVSTLFLLEPIRLQALLSDLSALCPRGTKTQEKRIAWTDHCGFAASMLRDAHKEARGEATVAQRVGTGCGALIVAFVGAAFLLLAAP